MMQLTSRSRATAARRLQGLQAGQAQPERGERAGVEEVAAGQAVAEADRLVGIDAEHRATSVGRVLGATGVIVTPLTGPVKRRSNPPKLRTNGPTPSEMIVINSSIIIC